MHISEICDHLLGTNHHSYRHSTNPEEFVWIIPFVIRDEMPIMFGMKSGEWEQQQHISQSKDEFCSETESYF